MIGGMNDVWACGRVCLSIRTVTTRMCVCDATTDPGDAYYSSMLYGNCKLLVNTEHCHQNHIYIIMFAGNTNLEDNNQTYISH